MNAYESMCEKMIPLKSYNFQDGSNIALELACYAVALDEHREMLDLLLRECFISTAETYGLENREKIVGDIKSDLSLESRREMIIIRNLLGVNDFTRAGFEKFFKCLGLEFCVIHEKFEEGILEFAISGEYTPSEKMWITRQMRMMIPAHLTLGIVFK